MGTRQTKVAMECRGPRELSKGFVGKDAAEPAERWKVSRCRWQMG